MAIIAYCAGTQWPGVCFGSTNGKLLKVPLTAWEVRFYMARDLQWAADTDSRQRLRSSSSQQLIVPRTRFFTVNDRAFGAAAARNYLEQSTCDTDLHCNTQ